MKRTLGEIEALAAAALEHAGAIPENARSVARALTWAEADGLPSHGIARLDAYCAQLRAGKVLGAAVPTLEEIGPSAARVDAADGFAYPAFDLAVDAAADLAGASGVAVVAIRNSHHFGVAGYQAERVANRGLVGMVMGNSPAAIAPWGGRIPLFGTNPVAFAFPRRTEPPVVVDASLSHQARGKIALAAAEGRSIPQGWALDAEGRETTDPAEALRGSMLPLGGAKGAALVFAVEVMAAAMTGSRFGFEASSFFDDQGGPPRVGQVLLAFDPMAFSGGTYEDRLEELIVAVLAQEGVRLPGSRRLDAREQTRVDGIELPDDLDRRLLEAAGAR